MPEMGGPALAVRMRALLPLLPVLLVSGKPFETGTSDRPVGSPPYRFLAKPFSALDLMTAVREAIASGPVNAS